MVRYIVLKGMAMNYTGIYICVAKSTGVFHGMETVTIVDVKDPRGRVTLKKSLLNASRVECSLCVTCSVVFLQ